LKFTAKKRRAMRSLFTTKQENMPPRQTGNAEQAKPLSTDFAETTNLR